MAATQPHDNYPVSTLSIRDQRMGRLTLVVKSRFQSKNRHTHLFVIAVPHSICDRYATEEVFSEDLRNEVIGKFGPASQAVCFEAASLGLTGNERLFYTQLGIQGVGQYHQNNQIYLLGLASANSFRCTVEDVRDLMSVNSQGPVNRTEKPSLVLQVQLGCRFNPIALLTLPPNQATRKQFEDFIRTLIHVYCVEHSLALQRTYKYK